MLLAVLSGFVVAGLAPGLHRHLRDRAGWALAIFPLGLLGYFAARLPEVAAGTVVTGDVPWLPALGVGLSLALDGLSLLFALIISGVGALVVVYAGAYLRGHRHLGRLYAALIFFMASMLGVVLADDLVALFVFWELTSISSYLLIGFEHERKAARSAALQALLVTGGGGLALLLGFLVLGDIGGTYRISLLAQRATLIQGHALYLPALLLVLAGAFTKSAQAPAHFWLPSAMEAPTPVSAYLHSATMVKAGIYLLARLTPVLGGSDAWHYLVTLAGAVTMLLGAVMALFQTDLKRLLAYTTVSALGTLTLLLGLGTTLAVKAALVFLIVHALYKGALFLGAGILDHETGTRDLARLGGLARAMPITAVTTVLAALSMAGLPPLIGFIGKELLYEAKTQAPAASVLVTAAGFGANALIVAAAAYVGRPFFGPRRDPPRVPHEAPPALWLGPALLAALGLLFGLAPGGIGPLLEAAVGAVRAEPTQVRLALWHGMNPIVLLSAATVTAGVLLHMGRDPLQRRLGRWRRLGAIGPARVYELALDGLRVVAAAQTHLLQSGRLRRDVRLVVAATVALAAWAYVTRGDGVLPALAGGGARPHELALAALMLVAAVAVARLSSRLAAVAALGAVGFGVAMTFLSFGGPDLALTQFAIETLSVVLFVFVLYRLPRFARLSSAGARARDAVVALAAGALMTVFVWAVTAAPRPSALADYFARASVPLGQGRNVVNVILVDFRGLDTLGEITVLAVAGIGVYALIRLRPPGADA